MPIQYGTYTKQLKLLPLSLLDDGSATVTVRFGYSSNGSFEAATTQVFYMPAEAVEAVLDAEPVGGLTRRDDLSLAIYQYLVTNGLVEAGEIS